MARLIGIFILLFIMSFRYPIVRWFLIIFFAIGVLTLKNIEDRETELKTLAEQQIVALKPPPPSTEWKTIDRYQVKNGLVTDTKMGLMWMRCGIGQHWNGFTCEGKVETYIWTDALKVPNNFSFDGYSDWRVPTREELNTLIYCSSGKPKTWHDGSDWCEGEYDIPTIFSGAFPNTDPRIHFWTSERKNSGYAWMVDFYRGMNQIDDEGGGSGKFRESFNAVRLVRKYTKQDI